MTYVLRCVLLAFSLVLTLSAWIAAPGVRAQTQLVKDIASGTSNASPDQLTSAGDLLFFEADDDVHDNELWATDGTPGGTYLVKDIEPSGSSDIEELTAYDGKLFFTARTNDNGRELWVSDGTTSGTHLVKEIASPAGNDHVSADVDHLVVFDGRLFFSADRWKKVDGSWGSENELWVSDGTGSGTYLFKDLYPGDEDGDLNESYPRDFEVAGDRLFFTASDDNGRELWVSDGTSAGTHLVKDIYPGTNEYGNPNTTSPYDLTAVGDKVFFEVKEYDRDDLAGLWVSDGTESGTQRVKAYHGVSVGYGYYHLTAYDGKLYFAVEDDTNGWEIWASDGTTAGTQRVKTMPSAVNDPRPSLGTVAGGKLFMEYGGNLWVTDGTEQGTQEVEIFDYGLETHDFFTAYDDRLYFAARKKYYSGYPNFTTDGVELWVSDGTTEGTMLAKDINPGGYTNNSSPDNESDPEEGVVHDGQLFFTADDGTHGRELWVSDGALIQTVEIDPVDLSPIELSDLDIEVDFSDLDRAVVLEVLRNLRAPSTDLNLPANRELAVGGTWRIDLNQGAAFTADVCLGLDALTHPRANVDFGQLEIYKREAAGSAWIEQTVELRPSASNPSQICATGVNGFSEFVVAAEPSALPVELAAFEATARGTDAVHLSWQTLSEQGNAGFRVERRQVQEPGSTDRWTTMTFVESQRTSGTSSETLSYHFRDDDLPFGARRLTYRLTQIDLDGTETVVGEQVIQMGAPQAFAVHGSYPNPFRDRATIRYELPETRHVTVEVYDIAGRRVRMLVDEEQSGRQEVTFEAQGLASGIYFYRLSADDAVKTRRMVLVQ